MRHHPSHLHQCVSFLSLLLFACALCVGEAQAQKKPIILNSDGNATAVVCPPTPINTTSANSIEYIHELEACYKKKFAASDFMGAAIIRNQLIYIGIEEIDAVFQNFRSKSRKRSDRLQFIFDFLEISAAATITIINGERAKSVIADILAAFQGSRAAFNKDFRVLQLQVLFNKMVANRSKVATGIYESTSKDAKQYMWETARSELQQYLFAGTIDDALGSLNIDTGAQAQTAQAQAVAAKKAAGIVGAPTAAQVTESTDNFNEIARISQKFDTAKQAELLEQAKAAPNAPAIAGFQATQKQILDGLKTVFSQIEADPKLAPLLDKIPDKYPLIKALAQTKLNTLRNTPNNATINDYDFILTKLNGVIAEEIVADSTLAGRLKAILTAKPL